MKCNHNKSAEELRLLAEKKLEQSKGKEASPAISKNLQQLVHELEVHQIELVMQNEELQQARSELEVYLAQYTDLYDFAPVGYFTLGRSGKILRVNLAGASMLEVERSRLINKHFDLFISAGFRRSFTAFMEKVYKSQSKETCEVAIKKEGEKPLYGHIEARAFEDGQQCRIAIVDITERKQAEEALTYHLQFEKMVSDISSYFVSLPSEQLNHGINYALKLLGEFFQLNRSYICTFSADGQTMSKTHEWCAEGTQSQMDRIQNFPVGALSWLKEQLAKKEYVYIPDVGSLPLEAEAEKEEFRTQDIRSLLCIPIINRGNLFGFLGFDVVKIEKVLPEHHIMLIKVVAELISNSLSRYLADEKIRHISFYDGLTGLYNRFYLEKEMERLDTARQLPIGIIMADLNGLKLVNDSFGHETGDEMLKQTAAILRDSCRGEDIIARWGGDEFVIFLPQTTAADAKAICQRIDGKCKVTYVQEIPLSLALGFAIKVSTNQNLTEVLKEADEIMYKHKLAESQRVKSAVLKRLLKNLEAKSFETAAHYSVMQHVAQRIGKKMGLSQLEFTRLEMLILLQDIGEVNISEEILRKKGPLTAEEWEIIRKHPATGYWIVRATEEFAHVAEDILSHHERWDGSGYPQGLKGKEIPLLARITAIVDAYEVMSSGRPYKKAMSWEEIVAELKRCAGFQFDPELVEIFLLFLEE